MRIVLTGAAGQIGDQIVDELSRDHELCLVDRRPVAHRKSVIADLSRSPMAGGWWNRLKQNSARWSHFFQGAAVVVHLAADPRPTASWKEVLTNNIQATWNVIEVAAKYRVPRVVFASSNWAVKSLERKMAPACYRLNGPKIGSDAPPAPLSAYGLSKAFGELTGGMFVDAGLLSSFVAVRIGDYNPTPPEWPETQARWIGVDDIRSLLHRCVEAEFTGFHIVYGVSAQPTAPYDLSHTRRLLSWAPRQSAIDL